MAWEIIPLNRIAPNLKKSQPLRRTRSTIELAQELQDREHRFQRGDQVRRRYLATVFGLNPSGVDPRHSLVQVPDSPTVNSGEEVGQEPG
jgi:hypothetical protein